MESPGAGFPTGERVSPTRLLKKEPVPWISLGFSKWAEIFPAFSPRFCQPRQSGLCPYMLDAPWYCGGAGLFLAGGLGLM